MKTIHIPEQENTMITKRGFKLTIDCFQNAIKKIEHPDLNWKEYEKEILAEARKIFPMIEIWRKWEVTYKVDSKQEKMEVMAKRSDLHEMFDNIISQAAV